MADKKMCKVFDSLQRGAEPRPHEIIIKMYPNDENGNPVPPDTETYKLRSDIGCEMPLEHGMKFLSDPSFRVITENGARLMPVPKMDISKPITNLKDTEVVVEYHELSREALFRRVKVIAGSEGIGENAKHQELVEFMVAWRKARHGRTTGDEILAEKMSGAGLDGQMTAEQLEKMFPPSKIAA